MNRAHGKSIVTKDMSGFTLLEVLIALVVLSIGLLGIAALQGVGIRSSHGAYLTSQASLLAYDIADRIRANPSMVPQSGAIATAAGDCELDTSGLNLADADRAEWSCSVQTLLPSGSGSINRAPHPNPDAALAGISRYTIDLEWADLQALELRVETEDETVTWTYQLVIEL